MFTLVIVGFMFVLLLIACVRIAELTRERNADSESDHAECLSTVASFVSNQFSAHVLLSAADALDGMDGQAELSRIANTVWTEGDCVPVLWLRERASLLTEDPS